ncbi:Pol polyprotein, partial [Trichinella patagoniensis]
LRPDDAQHINMAELDAVIKGLNLALSWQMRKIRLMTNSATVHRWVMDGLSGKARLKTKASGEMLIRRRVGIILSLVEEFGLELEVYLVKSACNKADELTCLPRRWLKPPAAGPALVCAATTDLGVERMIADVHHAMGHPGIRRTLYFARRTDPTVSKRQVRQVISGCEPCKSLDPAPGKWKRGSLDVEEVWQRVGMDITHVRGRPYLTLIDCGPSRFAVWRRLRVHCSANVTEQLEAVVYERGAPEELLTDNDTAFRGRTFTEFIARWGVRVRYRCAYAPSGNGIAERCHRRVKVIAARKNCTVEETVYLYNVTPRNGRNPWTAPANVVHAYAVRCGVRPPGATCDTRHHKGIVTDRPSAQNTVRKHSKRHLRADRRRRRKDDHPPSPVRRRGCGSVCGTSTRARLCRTQALDENSQAYRTGGVCYDGPSWNDARLYHGDITEFLELEYRQSTVRGSRGRARDLDLEVRSESLGLVSRKAAVIFDSVSVKCENLSQAIAAMGSGNGVDKSLDLRLIPEFDGSPQQSVVEWLEKVELVCKLRDISDVASVIPLRLTGGAFAVYLQLNAQERSSIDKVKEALLAAFAADPFVAYDQFVSRRLGPDESPDVFLAELRRLATLFGGVSEKALACAFVAGLPENVRQLLRAGSRMEDLGLSQILTRARAIITDERPVGAPNTCLSARGPGVRSPTVPPGQRCFECGGPNHFARDCLARRQDGDPGKRARDRGISASLLSPRPLTEALPAVRMNVGGIRRRVLVDTGCSVCVAHASCCRSWREEDVAITTMCGRAMRCEGSGVVQLRPHGKGPIEVEVIVVRSKPLGYDLILGMNGIAALGGVTVTGGRCVRFGLDDPGVCAAAEAMISIREKDFTATYCPSTRSWTAAWKWSDAGEPGVLRNTVEEYPPANVARGAYEDELRKWIGWLVPYDESEHGPPKGLLPLMAVI